MQVNNLWESPWANSGDFWFDVLSCLIFIIFIIFLMLWILKKMDLLKLTDIMSPIATAILNCVPFVFFKWSLSILIIILGTIIMWFAYSKTITLYARLQLKKIKINNKWEMERLESEYDLRLSKEELETIQKEAELYPRVGLLKFAIFSIIPSIIFFMILLLIGNKHTPDWSPYIGQCLPLATNILVF